jgi:hypothetical protein
MWNGRWWKADVEYKTLLDAGWKGMSVTQPSEMTFRLTHYGLPGVNHNISQDGLVAILTVYHL